MIFIALKLASNLTEMVFVKLIKIFEAQSDIKVAVIYFKLWPYSKAIVKK